MIRLTVSVLFSVLVTVVWANFDHYTPPDHHHHNHVTTETFSEGPCIKPEVAKEIDFEWLMKPRTFFVPIASQFAFRRNSEVYLSRSPEPHGELEQICQTVEWQKEDDGYNTTASGFGNEFYMKCKPEERGINLCKTRGGSPGTNPSKVSKTEEYITATDNKHYAVVVRCVDDLYKDYQVLTTYPAVPQDVLHKILDHIYDLGFNPRKLSYLPSTSCLSPLEYLTLPKLGWPREGSHYRDFHRRPSSIIPQLPYYQYNPFIPFRR